MDNPNSQEVRKGGAPRRVFTDTEKSQIDLLWKEGHSRSYIAREVGSDSCVIQRYLDNIGVPDSRVRRYKFTGRRPRTFSPEDIAKMAELWQAGKSQTFIAKQFDTCQAVVSRQLRIANVPFPLEKRVGTLRGSAHGSWKGGRARLDGGYIGVDVADEDPMSCMRNSSGYIPEHRLVMARHLGRPLKDGENSHHLNGIRHDNRLENLELWTTKQPKGIRASDSGLSHCPTCTCDVPLLAGL